MSSKGLRLMEVKDTMNVVVFVGNGFDIALGLKTGYPQFLRWWCEQNENQIDENRHIANVVVTCNPMKERMDGCRVAPGPTATEKPPTTMLWAA